jgi:hypothetical protein
LAILDWECSLAGQIAENGYLKKVAGMNIFDCELSYLGAV